MGFKLAKYQLQNQIFLGNVHKINNYWDNVIRFFVISSHSTILICFAEVFSKSSDHFYFENLRS